MEGLDETWITKVEEMVVELCLLDDQECLLANEMSSASFTLICIATASHAGH
jgi:hypothetical protein